MQSGRDGFTLIELSIVLVIIGLVVGGVLVGQDLIRAAEVRATITQVEKFNTAVNTFYGKYQGLPGDLIAATATMYGFTARAGTSGQGDGNGEIEASATQNACSYGHMEGSGETVMFWVDLSGAVAGNLIEGGFDTAVFAGGYGPDITGARLSLYLPSAKLGNGNYFYVYSGDYQNGGGCGWENLGVNYYGLSAVTTIHTSSGNGEMSSIPNISVMQAYSMDKKIDDGYPQSGNVMAWYLNYHQVWTDGTDASQTPNEPQPYSGSLPASSTTCYDNGGVSGATTRYSLGQNSGAGPNCALSFRFQ